MVLFDIKWEWRVTNNVMQKLKGVVGMGLNYTKQLCKFTKESGSPRCLWGGSWESEMREPYFLLNILLKMLQFFPNTCITFSFQKVSKLLRNNGKTTAARSSVCGLEMPGRDVLSTIKSRGEKIRGFAPSFYLYFPPLAPCHCLSFLVCYCLFFFTSQSPCAHISLLLKKEELMNI